MTLPAQYRILLRFLNHLIFKREYRVSENKQVATLRL